MSTTRNHIIFPIRLQFSEYSKSTPPTQVHGCEEEGQCKKWGLYEKSPTPPIAVANPSTQRSTKSHATLSSWTLLGTRNSFSETYRIEDGSDPLCQTPLTVGVHIGCDDRGGGEYSTPTHTRELDDKLKLEGNSLKDQRSKELTNRAAINISRLFDKPHARIPTPANITAI